METVKPFVKIKNKDIKARVTRRYIVGIVITAVWAAAVFIAVNIYHIGENSGTGTVTLILTIAVPVIALRPYRAITDRSWMGVVESAVRKNKPQKAIIEMWDRETSTIVPDITLYITLSDNSSIIKNYRLKKDQDHYAEALKEYYKAGTVIHCYRGIKYPKSENNIIILGNIAHRLCIVCGNFDDRSHTICRHCRSTFVE